MIKLKEDILTGSNTPSTLLVIPPSDTSNTSNATSNATTNRP